MTELVKNELVNYVIERLLANGYEYEEMMGIYRRMFDNRLPLSRENSDVYDVIMNAVEEFAFDNYNDSLLEDVDIETVFLDTLDVEW